MNSFLPPEDRAELERDYRLQRTTIPGAYSFEIPEDVGRQYRAVEHSQESTIFVERERAATAPARLSPFLFTCGASVIAALALGAREGDRVLDVCSAPGGKAAVLAASMWARRFEGDVASPAELRGKLVCNEVSKEKAMRLQRAMRDVLPALLVDGDGPGRTHVVFTTADACTSHNTMERHGPYDKILVDAPCTSDRAFARDAAGVGSWSRGTTKVSSDRQVKMLYNALWMLQEGGILLFTTTALAPEECDGVVEQVLTKVRGSAELEILPLDEDICRMVPGLAAESTDWGTRIMPDRTPFGPVYFCRIRLLRRTHEDVQGIRLA